jgi:hypothetical protein
MPMMETWALIALISGQLFVLDTGLTSDDCLAALERMDHIELKGINTFKVKCEKEVNK